MTLTPSAQIGFLPHPVHDALQFTSLRALTAQVDGQGYYGGVRLLMVCRSYASGLVGTESCRPLSDLSCPPVDAGDLQAVSRALPRS